MDRIQPTLAAMPAEPEALFAKFENNGQRSLHAGMNIVASTMPHLSHPIIAAAPAPVAAPDVVPMALHNPLANPLAKDLYNHLPAHLPVDPDLDPVMAAPWDVDCLCPGFAAPYHYAELAGANGLIFPAIEDTLEPLGTFTLADVGERMLFATADTGEKYGSPAPAAPVAVAMPASALVVDSATTDSASWRLVMGLLIGFFLLFQAIKLIMSIEDAATTQYSCPELE